MRFQLLQVDLHHRVERAHSQPLLLFHQGVLDAYREAQLGNLRLKIVERLNAQHRFQPQ